MEETEDNLSPVEQLFPSSRVLQIKRNSVQIQYVPFVRSGTSAIGFFASSWLTDRPTLNLDTLSSAL